MLFDEIEKAHEDVFNLLLQVMEDGQLTDSLGRKVNFRNAVVVMTSNVGAKAITDSRRSLGFAQQTGADAGRTDAEIRSMVMSDLKKTFRPEFLNRVDEIIVFHKLTRADTRRIAQKLLGTVNRRMERAGVEPGHPEHDRRSGGGDAARRLAPARRCGHGAGAGRKNCFDENVRTWYDNALNVIWTEAYPNMAQNMQTENKAVYLDPFRYNEFKGFNSHNHIVVTEVGDGTSVVEVKLAPESLNPLGMAHGGLIFTLCDVATGVAARTGGRITVTLDSNIHFLRRAKDTEKLVARGRVVKAGRTTGLVTAEVFDDTDKLIATADMTVYYVDENTYTDPAAQK